MLEIKNTSFRPDEELRRFQARTAGAGAIVSFTGLVRDIAASGSVKSLYLQSYSPLTENGIAAAGQEAEARWPLDGWRVVHRVGDMPPGEPIVFVAAAAAHRRAAFEAADFLMDYLKTEAVFWKKETTAGGEKWIEPRAEDYADRQRWTRNERGRECTE